jgi:hypothetical protein
MKRRAGGTMVVLVMVGIGVAGSACYDDTQASIDRNQQRLLRPTATGPATEMPLGPSESPSPSRNMDPKIKGGNGKPY